MKSVNVIAPKGQDDAGTVHPIPEADLQGFIENGWEVEGDVKKEPKKDKK